MKSLLILSLLLLLGVPGLAGANRPLMKIKILLGTTNESPYGENAPADILSTFNNAVAGRLFHIGPSFELQPGLIKSWRWDFKKNAYELTLKEGIHFHNGRPATAADLEFSLLRGFFSSERSFYKLYLGNIEGVEAAENMTEFKPGLVSGVKVTGSLSIEIRLKTANAAFLNSLGDGYFSLVAREALNADNITWKDAPVAAGPYKVVAPFRDGRVVVEKVTPSDGGPDIVEFYTRDSGENFDVALTDCKAMKSIPMKTFVSKHPASIWSMFFSTLHPLGRDENFKRALSLAIDRKELSDGVVGMAPAPELLPHHFWGRENKETYPDLEKAKDFLSKVPPNLLTGPLQIQIFAGSTLPKEREIVLSRLIRQLEKIGLKIEIKLTTDKFMSEEFAKQAPIRIFGLVTDYSDPLVMFSSFGADSPYKFLRPIKTEEFESRYRKASQLAKSCEKILEVRALSQFVNANIVSLPLVEEGIITYYQPNAIEGLGEQHQPLTLITENIRMKR